MNNLYNKSIEEVMKIPKERIYNHDGQNILRFENDYGNIGQVKYAVYNECYFEALAVLGVLIENVLRIYLSGELTRIKKIKNTDKPELPKKFEKMKLRFVDLSRICYFMSLISKDLFDKLETFRKDRNKIIHNDPYETYSVGFAKKTISDGNKIMNDLLDEQKKHSDSILKKKD